MALVYSVASGGWNANAATVWNTGAVPAASDTVEIRNATDVSVDGEISAISTCTIKSGGILTSTFQMSTSQFTTIIIDSGGKLYASRSVSNLLRCNLINANGTDSVDYGTAADPINNLAIGAFVQFVCTSDNLSARGFVTGVTDAITFYGATRVAQSTLAQVAAIGATQIVLADDMALRPGTLAQVYQGLADIIVVGHTPVQTANGTQNDEIDAYLVVDYDAATKTVTLGDAGLGQSYWPRGGVTPNWNTIHQTQREIGTPVWLLTYNVGLRGTAYNLRPKYGVNCGAAHAVSIVNASLHQCYLAIRLGNGHTITGSITGAYMGTDTTYNCTINAVICGCNLSIEKGNGSTIDGAMISGGISNTANATVNSTISGCDTGVITGDRLIINGQICNCTYGFNGGVGCIVNGSIKGCAIPIREGSGHIIDSEISDFSTGFYNNYGMTLLGPLRRGTYGFQAGGGHVIKGEISSCTQHALYQISSFFMASCQLSNNTVADMWNIINAEMRNCLFDSAVEFKDYNNPLRPPWAYVSSQDHDQVAGAFRAWCRGGVVNSNTDVKPTGAARSYQHIPESAAYPVFKQERISVAAGSTLSVSWWMRKDVSMAYLPRVQVIDMFADPLVSDANSPLAEQQMTDSIDTWESGTLTWQNTGSTPKDVYVRTLAKNASGNFYALTEAKADGVVGGMVRISPVLGGVP